MTGSTTVWIRKYPALVLAVAAAVWWALYRSLIPFSEWVVTMLPVVRESAAGNALQFFFYDTPKVLLLLTGVVFVMGIINTWFTPERTRALLAGRGHGQANILAAALGVVTPFCSCSSVPLFIGFVQAGVPLGVTFSFLIAAPMVDTVALTLLFSLFGWKIALLYLGVGMILAIIVGILLGKMNLERYLEEWVRNINHVSIDMELPALTLTDRLAAGADSVKDVVGRVWPYVLVGIGVGAGIHGYVPEAFMARIMGEQAEWWSVPAAVLIGVPMYTNVAGILPVIEALTAKGAAMGTALAFMMSVVALSFPEMVILRKVLTLRLIAIYVSIVALGILLVGYLFNMLL